MFDNLATLQGVIMRHSMFLPALLLVGIFALFLALYAHAL